MEQAEFLQTDRAASADLDRWLDETLEETFPTSDPIGARSIS